MRFDERMRGAEFHLLSVTVERDSLVAELPSQVDHLVVLVVELDYAQPRPDRGPVPLVPSYEVFAVPLLGAGRRRDGSERRQQCGDALELVDVDSRTEPCLQDAEVL